MAKMKEALIDDAMKQLKRMHVSMAPAGTAGAMTLGGSMEAGIWDSILAIVVPLFLEWFTKCLKGSASKKAAQIDDEYRRLTLVDYGTRKERKLHRKAEKLFGKPEVIEANGGNELTEEQQDELYQGLVRYAFMNRNAVAKAAATRG
jgi:hypothetical protein